MSQESIKKAILATVEAIENDPAMAKVRYEAATQWEEDMRCTARVRDFEPTVADEPAAFGGADSAISPGDMVLVALGTCQEIMYVALASTMDIPIDEVKVDVTGDLDLHGLMGLDGDVPPGILEMSYHVHLKSSAPEADLQRLVDTVEAQCPLLDTLTRPVKVSGKVTMNGGTEYQGAGSYLAQRAK
jgi:uncharacterized OsmC-like protein